MPLQLFFWQVNDLKAQLRDPNLKGIDDRFKKKQIELKTTEMACSDLTKCCLLLESCDVTRVAIGVCGHWRVGSGRWG